MKKNTVTTLLAVIILLGISHSLYSQKFIHPGIDQTEADLAYMKKQVLAGEQPWKDSFEKMKSGIDLNSAITPFTHVQRGPYGRPNIGGGELSRNSDMAYSCALVWYITGQKVYAEKAIDILNKWSLTLRDFDYNDAKLLAAWTGHTLCNAAEILKYSGSGWEKKDIESFTGMLMTVYYPLIRFYFPQANGNWDGAIIHTILAISIFTDNRDMFDNAIDHLLHGPVNGSLFKYIFPDGQCQESVRDQGHVQLGLDEFAGAVRVAWTQGTDLFSAGNNRLATGYEYTSKFLLGEKPFCYGIISERAKKLSDVYEYVFRHYEAGGLKLKYTGIAADSMRSRSGRNTLTAFRAPGTVKVFYKPAVIEKHPGYPAGARDNSENNYPENSVFIEPGQSIQEALDATAGSGRHVIVRKGIHTLKSTLKIPSGTILTGEGISSVLFLDPASGLRDAVINADPLMHDVTIRDLVIEGNTRTDPGTDPNATRSFTNPGNRGGIMFLSNTDANMKNIGLFNITVRNCTFNGVFISGVSGLKIEGCDFTENGSSMIPGPRLQHNLLITSSDHIIIKGSRLDTSPYGSGIALKSCSDAEISDCEIARNAYYGILISESTGINVSGNLIEANDRSGVMAEFLHRGSENINIGNNTISFNNGYGIESWSVNNLTVPGNNLVLNGSSKSQVNIRKEQHVIMK